MRPIDFLQQKSEDHRFSFRRNEWHTRLTEKRELANALSALFPMDYQPGLERIGNPGDGGYVLPKDLADIEFCISPGCNKVWDFEKDIYKLYGIKSILIDKQEMKPFDLVAPHVFEPYWLGTVDEYETRTIDHFVKLADSMSGIMKDYLLQMDIEGAEWKVLEATTVKSLKRFRIMVIEFHNFRFLRNNLYFQTIFKPIFAKILQNHAVVNINGNNNCPLWSLGTLPFDFPDVLEITFLRRDRFPEYRRRNMHNIESHNRQNIAEKEPIVIDWEKIIETSDSDS